MVLSFYIRQLHKTLNNSFHCCVQFSCDHRQEYNVRDKTKRELEFLEKVWSCNLISFSQCILNVFQCLIPSFWQGGNPLDLLKPGDAASVSVQSTSITNQHQDHLVTRYVE